MASGNIAFVKEMIQIFIEQVAELETDMKNALSTDNSIVLGKLAHKAKSTVSVMGMNNLSEQLKSLEHWANEGKEKDKYNAIVERFVNESHIAVAELKNTLKEL